MYAKLTIVQKCPEGYLGGPLNVEFKLNEAITITIYQCIIRKIEIESKGSTAPNMLLEEFQALEKLLMLFDGRFYPIDDIKFINESMIYTESSCNGIYDMISKRLSYYESSDVCKYRCMNLIKYDEVINTKLYNQWKTLLNQMGVVYQMYLYCLSDNKLTTDVNLAFLIEMAKPFKELVEEFNTSSKTKSKRKFTLRECVDSLTSVFGTKIFQQEEPSKDEFLGKAVNSRNRIMHIAKNQSEGFIGGECLKYTIKFSLLYRRILFELLNIKENVYYDALENATTYTDEMFRNTPS